MRIIKFILIISLLQLTSCCPTWFYSSFYPQRKEKNKNGVSKIHLIWRPNTMRPKPYGSYAADEKYVKNVELFGLNDTISKRCFKSYELENLKRVFLQDTIFDKKETISIRPYITSVDLVQCVGLFFVRINDNINGFYINIPLIKLNDTIFVNGISGIEADSSTQKYLEKKLLEVYDSIEVKKRMEIFMKGRFKERANKEQRVMD